jgi:hypothetical protein
MKVRVKLLDLIRYFERCSANTDTDPYWIAATALRRYQSCELIALILPGQIVEVENATRQEEN